MALSNVLNDLIKAAYAGSVFGPGKSFGADALVKISKVEAQIEEISDSFATEMYMRIKIGMPDISDEKIQRIIKEIGPKAVCFCPALTVGELTTKDDLIRLTAAATAIGTMYFADQTMDRGDEKMVAAIELLCGGHPVIADSDMQLVQARLNTLRQIKTSIDVLALSDDAPIVLESFERLVLYNEVQLHKLSVAYGGLNNVGRRQAFLKDHAEEIVNLMVVDAGFPSVTTSLYAIYRQNDLTLPSLSEVHGDVEIAKVIQICNAVVRIADEAGDWEIDAGQHPEWGVFVINPFNQYHSDIVTNFCQLAYINDEKKIELLQKAFHDFHINKENRELHERFITDTLFDHARDYINQLPPSIEEKYGLYLTLCRRVLEIGKVNMLGDKELADVE